MLFTLEALEARHGDSLVLHYGTADDPRIVVIDGGPGRVWERSLRPRLDQLKAERSPDGPLELEMVMVSHIDDDHINGILDLTNHLLEQEADGDEPSYDIATLWHNSFDGIVKALKTETAAFEAVAQAAAAAHGAVPTLGLGEDSAAIAASVPQGRDLRNNSKRLQLDVNRPFDGLVAAPASGKRTVRVGPGLKFTVIGPSRQRLDNLKAEWKKKLQQQRTGSAAELRKLAAEFLDDSIFNLSSIIVLAEIGRVTNTTRRTMLLTGDARGDDIIKGLRSAKLLKDDRLHVDLLKVPHHGSDRNVSTQFFRMVTADHYVISANGEHGNPDPPTLKMLTEARASDGKPYTIYMTNKLPTIDDQLRAEQQAGRNFKVVYASGTPSMVRVDLLDKLP